ncbi:MAG: ATPase [Deltaproteobacteria bacterium RIFCSPHIGHO2_02_FULL_60_17]|nr:MAG: ATPase [Deltaproteobacteria bacterium RIFCSPHIGHO2_02_FULL_60_17]
MAARDKLKKIREELRQTFLERGDLIDGALSALLSSQHVLIIGPPGTAKSMLADEICRRIAGASYFQWLLTRFSTPEEIFGAVSLKALEQDDYRRVTAHKLPEAHIAFLDEIFKANSSILNAILTLINERLFHNGQQVVSVPLLTLFGASNELPEDDELMALYDRFLLRFVVKYIEEDFRFLRMLEAVAQTERTTVSLEELREMQGEAAAVPIPGYIYRTIADIRRELGKKNIVASDRRYRQSLPLLQAHAYLDGHNEVTEKDIFFLEHALWRDPSEQPEVRATVRELLLGYEEEVKELLYESREIRDAALRPWGTSDQRARALIEMHTKLRNILAKVDQIMEKAQKLGRPLEPVGAVKEEIEEMQKQMLEKF